MKEISRKKRNKQYLNEKLLIRLKKKKDEIKNAIRNQSWIELEEPIHHGFYVEYVLRDDILRRADADVYQEALDACMEKVWNRTEEFRKRNKQTKRWEPIKPMMKDIRREDYEKLSPAAQKLFYENTTKERRYWRYGFSDKWFTCSLTYELVNIISKAYITHRREHDGVLHQQEAENDKIMHNISNGHPYGGWRYYSKFEHKMEHKAEKLSSERELNEVKKACREIPKDKKDLLDL